MHPTFVWTLSQLNQEQLTGIDRLFLGRYIGAKPIEIGPFRKVKKM
jgi:hypothetical protein